MLTFHPLPNPIFSASRWSEISVLFSEQDWEFIVPLIAKAFLFSVKNPVSEPFEVSKEALQEGYKKALTSLKEHREDFSSWTSLLPVAATLDKEAFFFVRAPSGKTLIQTRKPAVFLTPFFFHYSSLDQTFRSKVLGKEKIFWGMQFSFPYIYFDPLLKEIKKVNPQEEKNGAFFLELRKQVRALTKKASFSMGKGGDFRRSEKGLEAIFPHFQLEKKGIYVH